MGSASQRQVAVCEQGSCEETRFKENAREGTPPPMICKDLWRYWTGSSVGW